MRSHTLRSCRDGWTARSVFRGVALHVRARRRTRGSALPYPALRPADRAHSPALGQRAPDDQETREGGWAKDQVQRRQLLGAPPASPPSCRTATARIARHMAGHESARTTGLYNRRSDEVALDKVEPIAY